MDDATFDAVSRRASILTISTAGLAGLATLTGPMVVEAKKNKKKKKCNTTKKCKQQVGQCTDLVTALCGGVPECQDSIACCPLLGNCDASAFISCFVASLSSA